MPRPIGTRLPAVACLILATAHAVTGPAPARPRPTTTTDSSDVVDRERFAAVLADTFAGIDPPGRDYRAEADTLTPALIAAMQTVTAAEIAALHPRSHQA